MIKYKNLAFLAIFALSIALCFYLFLIILKYIILTLIFIGMICGISLYTFKYHFAFFQA
ncbi:TPA: hypothetical protein RTH03_001459 [Campylobacter jejuni]|nr:hypothetical protein [Campylobacter jejuni]HDZ5084569.1 hypothetical protein [Campylobacter jejuni]HDZ5086132.1 hypothetical protein [Campylobacter jejuni]HDZ5087259.1 hypothetical protein [Campylobacter jejuni]HDZ5090638.1 hypothetical protein [Campylobacter jejuni]